MSNSQVNEPASLLPGPAATAAAKGVLLPAVAVDDLPRLRIHHIMLLTAVTAVALSSVQLYNRFASGGGPMPQDAASAGVLMVGSILVSFALTVTLLGWWWGRERRIAFDQPGQRLALDVVGRTIAIVTLVIVTTLLEKAIVPSSSSGFLFFLYLGIYGPGLAIVILELFLARSQPPRSAWRFVFYTKALLTTGVGIATLLPMLGLYGIPFSMVMWLILAIGYVLVVLFQLVGIFRDRRQHIARHWTHWWGLTAHLGINLAVMSMFFVGLFSSWVVNFE